MSVRIVLRVLLVALFLLLQQSTSTAENTPSFGDNDDGDYYYYYYQTSGESGSGSGDEVDDGCATFSDDEDLRGSCSVGIQIIADTDPTCDLWFHQLLEANSTFINAFNGEIAHSISQLCQCNFQTSNLKLIKFKCEQNQLLYRANITKPSDYTKTARNLLQEISSAHIENNIITFQLPIGSSQRHVTITVVFISDGTTGGITVTTDPPVTVGTEDTGTGGTSDLFPGDIDMGGVQNVNSALSLALGLVTMVTSMTLTVFLVW